MKNILARLAMKTATDEDTRNAVLAIILIPVLITVLLICCVQYILETPMRTLQEIYGSGLTDEVHIIGLKEECGDYFQLVDDGDVNYNDSYEGIEFTDSLVPLVYYNQMDSRWGELKYGKNESSTIGKAGCGPTSLAMVVSSLTDITLDPIGACKWAYDNGYYVEGNGSKHSVIPDGAEHFGLTVEGAGVNEGQKLVDALKDGKLIVAIMGKGHFTKSGHFIVLRGVTSEGKILVGDPASKRRSEMEWDLSIILNEARANAGANGPFWIIGNDEV